MRVADLLAVKDSRIGNREKAMLIARMQKARAKRGNPQDAETPSGWNSTPFAAGATDHTR
jgi:hypothetical protein